MFSADTPRQVCELEEILDNTPSLCIDVGAFWGEESCKYAKKGHKVFAFEPTIGKHTKIQKNIADAGVQDLVTLVHAAVSDSVGTIEFGVNDNPSEGSMQDAIAAPWSGQTKVTVPMVTIDSYVQAAQAKGIISSTQEVLLFKVDSQGHDFHVLKGAEQLLRAHRVKFLLTEFSPTLQKSNDPEQSPIRMIEFLNDCGYVCFSCGQVREQPEHDGKTKAGVSTSVYVDRLLKTSMNHRGANHGGYDDLVCMVAQE
jgi:FkbM family methyltransferase